MNIGVKLNRLKNEDFIWIIYFFVAIAALYSNSEERKYYMSKSIDAKRKVKTVNITILTIAFFIYLYFVLLSTDDLKDFKNNLDNPKYAEAMARLIASILFLIGGAIYVVLEIVSNEPDEVGFI